MKKTSLGDLEMANFSGFLDPDIDPDPLIPILVLVLVIVLAVSLLYPFLIQGRLFR